MTTQDEKAQLRKQTLTAAPSEAFFCISCGKPTTASTKRKRVDCAECKSPAVKVSMQDDYSKHTGRTLVRIVKSDGVTLSPCQKISAYSYAIIKHKLGGQCSADDVLDKEQLEALSLQPYSKIWLA